MGFILDVLERNGFVQRHDITQYRRIIPDVVQG